MASARRTNQVALQALDPPSLFRYNSELPSPATGQTPSSQGSCPYGHNGQTKNEVRGRFSRSVPPGHQRLPADLTRRRGGARPIDSGERSGSARQARAVEPALRRLRRQEISESGRIAV